MQQTQRTETRLSTLKYQNHQLQDRELWHDLTKMVHTHSSSWLYSIPILLICINPYTTQLLVMLVCIKRVDCCSTLLLYTNIHPPQLWSIKRPIWLIADQLSLTHPTQYCSTLGWWDTSSNPWLETDPKCDRLNMICCLYSAKNSATNSSLHVVVDFTNGT